MSAFELIRDTARRAAREAWAARMASRHLRPAPPILREPGPAERAAEAALLDHAGRWAAARREAVNDPGLVIVRDTRLDLDPDFPRIDRQGGVSP